MRVLVAGATGAIGRQLVPRLVGAGHEVVGMVRSPSKRDAMSELGASAVIADALVAEQVAQAVRAHPTTARSSLRREGGGPECRGQRQSQLVASAPPGSTHETSALSAGTNASESSWVIAARVVSCC